MRILLATDNVLLRDALIHYLAADPALNVEGVGSYQDVVKKFEVEGPVDLLLLDYRMPGMYGMQGLHDALQHQRAVRVALMSADSSRLVFATAMAAGAAGFIPKTLSAKSFRSALMFMMSGEVFLPAELFSPQEDEEYKLNKRELAVLSLLGEGKDNKAIAQALGLSEVAVKQYVRSLFRRLNVENRTQAALLARDLGLR